MNIAIFKRKSNRWYYESTGSSADRMTDSLQRFESTLKMETPDRPPIIYQHLGAGGNILRDLGLTMKQVHDDPQLIADCQVRARKVFGHDTMMAGWGVYVEAHSLGSLWKWNDDYYYPKITDFRIKEQEDLDDMEVPDPLQDPTMRNYIEALRIMMRDHGDKVPVIGFVNGPLMAAEEFRKCEDLFMDMILNKDFCKKTLDLMTRTCERYMESMLEEADVHGILIEGGTLGGDQLSREQGIEFDLEYCDRLVGGIKKRNKWTIIHNGSSKPYLDLHSRLAPDAIDFWIGADLKASGIESVVKSTSISTGVDACNQMLFGNPDEIVDSIVKSNEIYGKEGSYIIGAGGEIPFDTAPENVWAMRRGSMRCSYCR